MVRRERVEVANKASAQGHGPLASWRGSKRARHPLECLVSVGLERVLEQSPQRRPSRVAPTSRHTGIASMDLDEYEVFEHLPDDSLDWRGPVRGLKRAQSRVWQLADGTGHECFAMETTTSKIALARTPLPGAKRIFQVAYGKALSVRARLLHRDGYDVTSAFGNRAARLALRALPRYELFVIGHAASESVRLEMAHWIRVCYPHTNIVALNPDERRLDDLRYSAPNEPATGWLPLVSAAVSD